MKTHSLTATLIQCSLSLLLAATCLLSDAHAANKAYLRSTTGLPWGVATTNPGSNESAMNTAFGAGNWDDLRFETANVASLFSANYSLIYLDGSDSNATELEAFLNSHLFTIEATVFALGSTTVVPGGNTTFTVTVTPGALGARPAAIHIANAESLRCMSHPAASS